MSTSLSPRPHRSYDAVLAFIVTGILSLSTSTSAATAYLGLEPGVARRAQIAQVLGEETPISDTLSQYDPQPDTSKIVVEYVRGSDIAGRIEVTFARAQSRESMVARLGLSGVAGRSGSGTLREFYGSPHFIALNYVSADVSSGVRSVGYYSATPFEAAAAKAGAASSAARTPTPMPVVITAFTNFACPYCRDAARTIQRIVNDYGARVQIVYRHFPLDQYPTSRPAAEAALCANEQGRFWAYHDQLYGETRPLLTAVLSDAAAAIGLEPSRFGGCVAERRYRGVVDADLAAGRAAGVGSTPTFFINMQQVAGAQPYESFKEVIDRELRIK